MSAALRAGYKLTEVGVIPKDWVVMPFGQFAAPRKERIDPRRAGVQEFCVELEHIGQASGNLIGSTSTGDASSLKTVFQIDDVLFGKLRAYLRKYWLADSKGVCSTEVWALVANSNLAVPSYVYQVVTSEAFIEAASNSYGTHMPRSDWNLVKSGLFALPQLHEQRAIATALSDVDALLAKQGQLIAKKQGLKQAAMQQLLTGQTRLPGFSGDWEVKRLGDVGRFLKGGGVKKDQSLSGEIPCIRYGEIYTRHNDHVKVFYSWISPEVALTATKLHKGDLCFAGSGETKEDIGKCVAFTEKFEAYAGGDIVILRPHGANSVFLGYYLNTNPINAQKASKGQGDAVVHISASALSSIEISVPTFEEQTAIATILSDMDTEIAALEERQTKTRALKQGMMQELLTGKTRLV